MEYLALMLVIITFSFIPTNSCQSVKYYVRSNSLPSMYCSQPCYLLDYYAMNPSLLSNKRSVSLIFYDGVHSLNHSLEISRTNYIQLSTVWHNSTVTMQCNEDIWLNTIEQFKMVNLTIRGGVELKKGLIWPKSFLTHTGAFAQLQNLIVDGLTLSFAAGKSSLQQSTILNSAIHVCSERTPHIGSSLMLYKSNIIDTRIGRRSTRCTDIKLTIVECTIARSNSSDIAAEQNAIMFDVNSATKLTVNLTNTTMEGYAKLVGNDDNSSINLLIHGSDIKYTKSCLILKLGFEAKNNHLQMHISGSNISNSALYGISTEVDMRYGNTIEILLSNAVMKNHTRFGAIKISSSRFSFSHNRHFEWPSHSETILNIKIVNCTFIHNKVAIDTDLASNVTLSLEMLITGSSFVENENALNFRRKSFDIMTSETTSRRHLSLSLRNVTLENNHPKFIHSGVIYMVYVDMLNIHDCKIINNTGTAIESYFSALTLFGENLFRNNTSTKGGALVLYESYLYFTLLSRTLFVNNSANDIGGAIYVTQLPYFMTDRRDESPCFYQVHSNKDSTNLYIGFRGNMAEKGGHDIYGGTLHGYCRSLMISESIHHSKFHFESKSLSSVTSDPKRVCLCDNQGIPQCAKQEYIYQNSSSYYPGEVFTIPVVVVGSDFGTVPGIVHSKLTWINSMNNIKEEMNLQVQEIKDIEKCSLLTFSIRSQMIKTSHQLQLFVTENGEQDENLPNSILLYSRFKLIGNGLLSQHVYINFTLLDCPMGFSLATTKPYVCNCHPKLLENDVSVCIIKNHTSWIYRSGTTWVSHSFNGNRPNSFIIHKHCPYHYCKQENISVNLMNPDTQCAFNHSGVLCGGCYGNLSLALGSAKCLPCDNHYLSLLVAFVAAGLALVVLIKMLDLTVTNGTINGLIFYANVVWANSAILFPTTDTLHPAQQFFYTFVAWLNMDLGIETCFIEGLDAYWKTWLQFLFPLYVWCITGVVIAASHYSTRVSRIFGNNSVPVLATLLLLSYTKLLRTIIISLGFSLLSNDDGTRIVWSFDGNVPYFNVAHTILFLVALASLILLWLPYTSILLTLQWLRQKSYIKPLRWINRWKPFFDAYFGHLKPKYQYWVGLLLLLRVLLLVLYAATSTVVPRVNILSIVIVGLFVLVYMKVAQTGFVYTSVALSLLEGSFILNLTILGIVKLYLLPNDPAHTPVIYTSVGIAFIEFLIIITFHTWNRMKSLYYTHKRRRQTVETKCICGEMRVTTIDTLTHDKGRKEPLLVQQTSVHID